MDYTHTLPNKLIIMPLIHNRYFLFHPIVLSIYILLIISAYFFWDVPVAHFFYTLHRSTSIDNLIHVINNIGLGYFYVIGFPILAFIFLEVLKKPNIARAFVFLWLCLMFAGAVCDIIKVILARARPEQFLHYQQYGFFYWLKFKAYYWSFPSGHTTVIASIMIGLSYLKPRYTHIFICIALIVSAMRIVLAQHYISDVMTAFYLSLVCVYFLHAFYLKKGYTFPQF